MMIVFYLQYKKLLPSVEKMQEKLPAELIQVIKYSELPHKRNPK